MLSKMKQKKQEGFTIIEVLIVLAIAGLIMLVVFLAVPALQRNARNTQRNNDVAAILGGMSEYVNNNSGQLPGAFSGDGASLIIGDNTSNTVEVNLGFYGADEVTLNTNFGGNDPDVDDSNVHILTGATCDGNAAESGPSRAFVARYQTEVDADQCQQS